MSSTDFHCCVCNGCCMHANGPFYFARHEPYGSNMASVPSKPVEIPIGVPEPDVITRLARIEEKLDRLLEIRGK